MSNEIYLCVHDLTVMTVVRGVEYNRICGGCLTSYLPNRPNGLFLLVVLIYNISILLIQRKCIKVIRFDDKIKVL